MFVNPASLRFMPNTRLDFDGATCSIAGTLAIVSTLLTTVGDAYRPEVAGNGGLRRG